MLFAAGAEAGDEDAGAADESEDDGGVFRRIDAAGLGAERKSDGERECEGDESTFHSCGLLDSQRIERSGYGLFTAESP
jgi:hypothetical protein